MKPTMIVLFLLIVSTLIGCSNSNKEFKAIPKNVISRLCGDESSGDRSDLWRTEENWDNISFKYIFFASFKKLDSTKIQVTIARRSMNFMSGQGVATGGKSDFEEKFTLVQPEPPATSTIGGQYNCGYLQLEPPIDEDMAKLREQQGISPDSHIRATCNFGKDHLTVESIVLSYPKEAKIFGYTELIFSEKVTWAEQMADYLGAPRRASEKARETERHRRLSNLPTK